MSVKALEERNMGQALWRGTLCKCPHCGKGKMFRAYLKVAENCNVCGEELNHHRADDMPPYIAITIVGHILVVIMLHMEMTMRVNPVTYLYTMLPLAVILPVAILPSVKGFIVALQWANRMHGFDPAHKRTSA